MWRKGSESVKGLASVCLSGLGLGLGLGLSSIAKNMAILGKYG